MTHESIQKRKAVITAVGLGVIAMAIFIGFFIAVAQR